jgi:hypothetical protein
VGEPKKEVESRRAHKPAELSSESFLSGPRKARTAATARRVRPKEIADYLRSQRVKRRQEALYAWPENLAATAEKQLLELLAS